MTNFKKARQLARKVHATAIEYAKENGMRDDLVGMCLISSTVLYILMKSYGYNAILKHGKTEKVKGLDEEYAYNHCWVELNNKIYDVTFKQFDKNNPLFIGEKTPYHEAFKYVKDVEELDCFYGWAHEQIPFQFRIDWFLDRILNYE
jgi:hypothetical protein